MARKLIDANSRRRVIDALVERHGAMLDDERFEVRGHLEGDTVVVGVTLASRDRTFVYEMEAAVTTRDKRIRNVDEAVDTGLDFLDWYIGEYLSDGRQVLLPLDWQRFDFGELELVARGDVKNEVVDQLADAWLRGERPEIPEWLKKKKRLH